ncbi:MAG: hypothetical protein Q8L48_25350 [Archangium sp.]|nr:hypothetical protein [Archangium sp.]
MSGPLPNPEAIRATWRWLAHAPHGVSEVRVIRPSGGVVGIGFFDDEDAFVRECVRCNSTGNVYVGIQPRPTRLLGSARNTVRPLNTGAAKKDIEVLTATVIDLDPVRPKDSASTEHELSQALDAASRAADWCITEGLAPPRLMMSGNGAQLWFALPPSPINEGLQAGLKAFETELRAGFQTPQVHVDSIHDASRIIKVIGTVSHKGDGRGDRPHRLSEWRSPCERLEDPRLLSRLRMPTSLPLRPAGTTTKARRTSDGQYDWGSPVDMCAAVRRLWQEGAEDRSLAIFNMVRFFAHKGLGLDEITELVLEYDRRGLGKLSGRDGPAYIRRAWEKIIATADKDGSVAPPCQALRKLGLCHEAGVRCDLPVPQPERAPPAPQPRKHRSDEREEADEPPDDAIEGEIYEDARCYYTVTARGESKVVSSFTITPTSRVATEDGELIIGDAHTDRGTTVALRLPLSAFHSKRDFIRHLPSADLQWTGSDNNVQGLLRVLARREVPRRPGSTMLGEYKDGKHHLWLGPDCAIDRAGFIETPPVAYVHTGASLGKRLDYLPTDDETFQSVAKVVFECLPKVNQPQVVLPMLGWFFATPMKPRFMDQVGAFPTLFVWGTQGSGKSSLCIDVFWPLFGVRDAEPYSATETEFALLKLLTSTNAVPVFIDEYKPYDMPKHRLNTLHRYLRRLYRGETEERGRPDLKVNTYHLQAPVCVAGETRPTEAALLERIITANPDKTALETRNSFKLAYRQLRAVDLVLFAPRYIQFCLGRDFDADLVIARAVAAELLKDRQVPVRVAENITVMLLGIHLFEEFAKACGVELPEDLGAKAAVDAVLDDVLETDHGVKNALDHFLEMLGVMAVQDELRPQVHYALLDEGRLAVHLESAYDSFRAHCKRIDYQGEVVDLKALRRLLSENRKQHGYVVEESQRVCFAGKASRRRAFIVDLSKTGLLTADDFASNPASAPERRDWSDAS